MSKTPGNHVYSNNENMARYGKSCFYLILLSFVSIASFGKNIKEENSNEGVVITGKFLNGSDIDSIAVYYWSKIISNPKRDFSVDKELWCKVEKDSFFLIIDSVAEHSYISIGWGKTQGRPLMMLDMYIVSPGDSIVITITNRDPIQGRSLFNTLDNGLKICSNCPEFKFSGRGANKYSIRYLLNLEVEKAQFDWDKSIIANSRPADLYSQSQRIYDNASFVLEKGRAFLQKQKASVSNLTYELLVADMEGKVMNMYYSSLKNLYRSVANYIQPKEKKQFLELYQMHLKSTVPKVTDKALALSSEYATALISKLTLENMLGYSQDLISAITSRFNGELRNRLLANYIMDNFSKHTLVENKEAVSLLNDEYYVSRLSQVISNNAVGTLIPDFPLQDANNRFVRISDLNGKIVFIDFWFTGCSGCMVYFRDFVLPAEEKYKDNSEIVFVSVSIDGNKDKWIRGLHSGKYASAFSTNLYTGPAGILHPLIKQLNIQAYPYAVVLDRQGRILFNGMKELRKTPEDLINKINLALKMK